MLLFHHLKHPQYAPIPHPTSISTLSKIKAQKSPSPPQHNPSPKSNISDPLSIPIKASSHISVMIPLRPLHIILLHQPIRRKNRISCHLPHNNQKRNPKKTRERLETYLSIFFLISATSNTPLLLVAPITSATNSACPIVFLDFMILTIAACVS